MSGRGRLTVEGQLDVARAVVLGLKLDDIAEVGGFSQGTASLWRKRILAAIEERGLPAPTCACGGPVNHLGQCGRRRRDLSEPGPFTDEQLEGLLAHAENGGRRKPPPAPEPPAEEPEPEPQESSEAKFARQIGRSVGWGESEASIRKRLGISRLDLEHAKREHVEAYNAGIEEGRVRLFRAQNAEEEAARATPAEPAPRAEKPQRLAPEAARREPAKPAQRPPDPDRSDAIRSDPVAGVATEQEKRVAMLLGDAWDAFLQLDEHGVHDIDEFHQAIHRAQAIVGMRIARRVDPDFWRQA